MDCIKFAVFIKNRHEVCEYTHVHSRHVRPLEYIADSIKVALGFGNCALGSFCLVVTQVNENHCIVPICPNTQWTITNDQLSKQPFWI